MAEVILGIGSSHSPALLMDPEAWLVRGKTDDRSLHQLYDFDGVRVTYDELLAKAGPDAMEQLQPDLMAKRHAANQAGIAEMDRVLREADPDLVVIIGDDHKEVFQDDNMPAISVYWGETLPYRPQGLMKWKYDSDLEKDLWYPQEEVDHPVDSNRALRLIDDLMRRGFDISHSKYFQPEQGMSHSFGYVYHKIMTEKVFPVIPISMNTYYPPNQVQPRRAYQLGRAIRQAIEAWDEPLRVVIMATGGLSHFVVDEEFDQEFLRILAEGTEEDHANLPLEKLQSGNSELRCWSALAGAMEGRRMELIDYVPCYRSQAGTGCGMAFATWR